METLRVPKKPRVLFIATFYTSFIEQDVQILRKFAHVKCLIRSGIGAIFSIVWNLLFCDVVLCWFASVYSGIAVFFAGLLGKPSIVVIGGVDVAAVREIGYGIWLTKWKRPFVRMGICKASRVLAVDPSLIEKAKQLAQYDGNNIRCLPTGYDDRFWYPEKSKQSFILTVACSRDKTSWKVKGIDFLLDAARSLPAYSFVVVGIDSTVFKQISVHKNVTLLPFLSKKELRTYYQQAAVYCQPSRSEGLPNALCEAMLCECIPVGTDAGGIPHVIGKTGFVVPFGDIPLLVKRLRQALKIDMSKRILARKRIIQEFPLKNRDIGLRETIAEILCD